MRSCLNLFKIILFFSCAWPVNLLTLPFAVMALRIVMEATSMVPAIEWVLSKDLLKEFRNK